LQSSVTAIIPCKLKTYPRKELPPGSWGKEGRSVGGGEADLLHDVFELGCAPFITPLEVGPGLEQHWDCHPFPARACVRAVVAHTVVPGGDSALCKRFLVGSFREELPAKLGSRAAVGRLVSTFLLSYLDRAAEPLKGSTIYNAMQRALGAKVGRGVYWLGQQHVKSSLGHPCSKRARFCAPHYRLLVPTGSIHPLMLTLKTHRQLMPGARHAVSWSRDSYCSGCRLLHACKHGSNKLPCFLKAP